MANCDCGRRRLIVCICILPSGIDRKLTLPDIVFTFLDMTALIRVGALKEYRRLMAELDADPVPLLQRYGISLRSLDDEEAMIPLRSLVNLLESSATVSGCPDFGLRLAQMQDISLLGPLALAIQNEPTVGAGLQTAARYLYVHSPGLLFSVREHSALITGACELRFEIDLPRQPVVRQAMDQSLGDTHRIAAFLAGTDYQLHAVALTHHPVAPLSSYARFFGAPVLPAQEHAGLHVSPSTLRAPLREVNQTLRELALAHVTRLHGDADQRLAPRVRSALRQTLSVVRGDKNAIARLVSLHPRTLQRRLAAEGVSFDELREQVRREAALRYLCETRVPLSQLAGMLGLSEQSALTRCCRRWFGRTPTQLRRDGPPP